MSAICPVCGQKVRISKGVLAKHRTNGSVCPQSGSEPTNSDSCPPSEQS